MAPEEHVAAADIRLNAMSSERGSSSFGGEAAEWIGVGMGVTDGKGSRCC
jgi:hypothetical protein